MKIEPKPSDREVLAGVVERVTFQNAENGFCVVRVKVRGYRELVTNCRISHFLTRVAAMMLAQAARKLTKRRTTVLQVRFAGLPPPVPRTLFLAEAQKEQCR
jgi:hypothetical protein